MFHFELLHVDPATGARRGRLTTPHGTVETPAFMPVGTLGTVKGLTADQVAATGAEMVLGNTYHLALRPGEDVVADLGGLHQFMGWQGPILTDSGGFQIFSLADQTKITEEGATFRSHIDGSLVSLTPERAVEIQQALSSDIAMVLDHVVGLPAGHDLLKEATERSVRWARRCQQAHAHPQQVLFGIVQGGLDPALRAYSAQELVKLDFPGYAVGGLSVGESTEEMVQTLACTVPHLPPDRPRYLMGVGRPEDLVSGIEQGIDLFDCVMPTRNGRNSTAFTDQGTLRLRKQTHQRDNAPLARDCSCLACRHSRGYLRHLFQASEMLGPILVSHHNLTYYQDVMRGAREAIEQNRYASFAETRRQGWRTAY